LAEIAIPCFKHEKMKGYLDAMNNFCTEEISNSKKQAECWTDFMGTIKAAKFR